MTTSSQVTGKELPVRSISRRGRVRPQRDFAAMEQRRMRAVDLFERGVIPAEIARQVGVSHQIVSDWRTAWRQSGREALRAAGRAGRRPKLSSEQLAEIEAALAKGAEANGYRSEERRVGKECRARGAAGQAKKSRREERRCTVT